MPLILFAFLVGLVTFIDPCILVTVPAYFGYLGNIPQPAVAGAGTAGENRPVPLPRWLLIRRTLLFIAGYTTIFLVVGILVITIGHVLSRVFPWISTLGGILAIVIGLALLGTLVTPMTKATNRIRSWFPVLESPTGAYTFGLSLAIAWIPCAGSIMAAVVALAGFQVQLTEGLFLLIAYSIGLSIPFLLVALGADALVRHLKHLRRLVTVATAIGGIAMILIGILVVARLNGSEALERPIVQVTQAISPTLSSFRQNLEKETQFGSWWKGLLGTSAPEQPHQGPEHGGEKGP